MNKTAIKNFAVWARKKLIDDITYKAGMLGITEKGIAEKLLQSTTDLHFFDIGTRDYVEISGKEIHQRNALVSQIKRKEMETGNYKDAFQLVVEEVAYTWFNRLIAIRFMEVNNYLPSGIRVLSSEVEGKTEPDIVTDHFSADLDLTIEEHNAVIHLKDSNKLDELFRMLFIKQCNKLHEILPELFEKTDDYTELLLTISFTDRDGIVYRLTNDINEDDFNVEKEGQVEIIGWLYQYYNTEPKAAVFAKPKGTKLKKEEIPAATQLFTPDWIVRYMVENSLGRIWVDGHPNDSLKQSWKYYVEEANQEPNVIEQLNKIKATYKELTPEDIKIIDPCMGSGHILVYAFDILMQIYESQGYGSRDAARSILANNIFGLDIDERAYQLAYFSVMMKARQYNRRILTERIDPNLCFVKSSQIIPESTLDKMGTQKELAKKLISDFKDGTEYGSLVNVSLSVSDIDNIKEKLKNIDENKQRGDLEDENDAIELTNKLKSIIKQAKILAQKYEVVITNPPYMTVSNASSKLSDFVKSNYPDSKADLFACFIDKSKDMLTSNGLQAMITMHSWMFLSSYEKLRKKMMHNDLINMIHLGARAFEEIRGEKVQTVAFILRKISFISYKSVYYKLIKAMTSLSKEKMFLSKESCYIADKQNFKKIPSCPISYWAGEKLLKSFENQAISKRFDVKKGSDTGNNDKYLRLWHEVKYKKIGINLASGEETITYNKKWVPYDKGGSFRKWYGNNSHIINWENDGYELKNSIANLRSQHLFFKDHITWNALSSSSTSARLSEHGSLFDSSGSSMFPKELYLYLAFMNSIVVDSLLECINPTLNYGAGSVGSLPCVNTEQRNIQLIEEISFDCVQISKIDWDSFETSWDFKRHPLIKNKVSTINEAYLIWEEECQKRFNQLKSNEEELNRIFIDIYGLQDELTPEVEEKNVTVCKADLQRDTKSLISYAVGCMFGRYSVDAEGLIYAGGEWDSSKYKTFIPDEDNCIPITDEEYFKDDIVGRFVEFIKVVYGAETLEENLEFIANALGNKGKTSREVIRNYFLKDFIKDHNKIYQKRPIYWMCESGDQNGFKALIYMHRWNADTIGNMRVEYLHRMQKVYEHEIGRMQEIIDNSSDSREVSKAVRRKEKLIKQLQETKEYDARIAHLALARIDIDLDDGVKVNYEKVQTSKDGEKLQVLAKV